MHLIVTRPQAQAAGWVRELQALGLAASALPLIEITALDDPAPLRQAWRDLSQRTLVMFVSANAVVHFFAAAPPGRGWPAGVLAGSTGPGTSAALRSAGVPVPLLVEPAADAPKFDSEALWERLASRQWAGLSVLVVRGEDGRDWLAETLRERGAAVDFLAAYRRRPPALTIAEQTLLQQSLADPAGHLWLFSSSEAVGHLRVLAPAADWTRSAALASHPRIAQAAGAAGFGRVDLVAPRPAAVAAAAAAAGPGRADRIEASVTDTPAPPPAAPVPPAEPVPAVPPPSSQGVAASAPLPVASGPGRWIAAGAAVLAALATAALVFAWNTQQRVKALEIELVKRQQDSASLSTEARTLARNADVTAREAAAKMALLEARVAETTMQRSQLEDLIQSLARSRDENVLADVEAAIRVALQQSAITGSAEPLVLTLKQADERLARYNQPRLERVRRAVAQDLERTRTAGVTDVTVLTIRLDDVIRQVDDLPLLALPERRAGHSATARPGPRSEEPAAAPAQPASDAGWSDRVGQAGSDFFDHLWQEVKALIRVTRIDQPEAMLVTPEQSFFLRENLKLRLLNARLALLSRQFDTAQSDLRDAQSALDRYFDRNSRRVVAASETVRQVMGQSRLVNTPRPDATLAAIAAAAAGR